MFGIVQCCKVKGMLPYVIVMHGIAGLYYHMRRNPWCITLRVQLDVKPGSDYNLITPVTFTIFPDDSGCTRDFYCPVIRHFDKLDIGSILLIIGVDGSRDDILDRKKAISIYEYKKHC